MLDWSEEYLSVVRTRGGQAVTSRARASRWHGVAVRSLLVAVALAANSGCNVYDAGLMTPINPRALPDGGADAFPAYDASAKQMQSDAASMDAAQVSVADTGPLTSDAACSGDAPSTCPATCAATCAARPHAHATSCSGTVCTIESCDTGYADCDGATDNGCEQDTTSAGPCVPDASCTRHVYQGGDYYFCTNSLTWPEARAKCRAYPRGDLVRIDDQAEGNFVTSTLAGESWLGASDVALEGLWRWSDNAVPFWHGGAAGSPVLGKYANWASGQPDSASPDEDCAALLLDGTWRDQNCHNVAGFVCEVSPDACPEDAAKIDPGQCGCGAPDSDADQDGFAACNDACPNDPAKLALGACGCGVADLDSDGDTLPDCRDACPSDPSKTAPGVCDCGVADIDSDGDSALDCNESCDTDPNKLAPGACGCGVVDVDSDGDGAADCIDACPNNPSGSLAADGCGLGFAPSNLLLSALEPQHAAATTVIDCAAVLNTDNTPSFTTWCSGAQPQISVQSQAGGPELAVVALRGLDVRSTGRITITGSRAAALVVFGDASIAGIIDASANGAMPGAGADIACGTSDGGDVTTCSVGSDETGGGGGGGFGTAGGRGGDGDDCGGRDGGAVRGTPALVPLLGGCHGGTAGLCSGRAAGGGAFQLTVGGALTITGTLRANGANGPGRCSGSNYYGGAGGGSGGAIRIEASTLNAGGATLQVNGGKGGSTTSSSGTGTGGNGSTSPSSPGDDASNPQPSPQPDLFGGGGGGGGYGRIVLCNHSTNAGCP
jgi:hypothetical protein